MVRTAYLTCGCHAAPVNAESTDLCARYSRSGEGSRMGKRIENAVGESGAPATFLQYDDACLAKVEIGEPIFVLRAQDITAPNTIRSWALALEWYYRNSGVPVSAELEAKVSEALETARQMEEWPLRKLPD